MPTRKLKTRLAPQHLLLLLAGLGLAGLGLMLWLYLQAPYMGLTLVPADRGLLVTGVASEHPNSARLAADQNLQELGAAPGVNAMLLLGSDLVDEPDTLVGRGAVSEFKHRQRQLHAILNNSTITAVLDGQASELVVTRRSLSQVPMAYWLQSLAGWLCLVIGGAVLVFQKAPSRATRYFFTAGIAIYIAAAGGAVYATRELVLPPGIFSFVLLVNHLGTVLIVACLLGLIWHYPYRLARHRFMTGVFLLAGLALAADQWDVGGVGAWLLYLYCSLGFFLGATLAVFQWRRTHDDPVNRAAMRWFLLAMVVGVVTPSLLVVVPALFGAGLPVTHEIIFFSMLVMYIGVALGISRYRLFDLDVWWFRAWAWFLGGLSVLLVDVLLIGLFNLDSAMALTVAVALTGWIYFPIRQWLLHRLLQTGAGPLELAMKELVDALSGAHSADTIQARWPDILRKSFAALRVHELSPAPVQPQIGEHGTVLKIPGLADDHTTGLEIAYPKGGSRLFNREDVRLAELLLGLMRRATAEIRAREVGAEAERARMRRDMHDDLGARLLDMAQSLPDEPSREMARDASGRLRGILSAMSDTPQPLMQIVTSLADECEARLQAAGIELNWQNPVQNSTQLSARQCANLSSIVREASNNIIRHSGADTATFEFSLRAENESPSWLNLCIHDNGRTGSFPTAPDGGIGLPGMQARAGELGGRLDVDSAPGGGMRLQLQIPLNCP